MSNVQETPVKAGASQFANHNAVQINSTDFRKGLLLELKNTVLYNRPEVEDMIFLPREHSSNKALNLLSGNDEIMQKMVKRVKHACKDSLKDVKHLAARATKKGSQPLVAPRKQELKLYAPLRNILECIESLCIRTKLDRPYYRKLICNSERPLKPDDGTTGDIFSLKPDFPLVEIRPSKDGRSEIDIDHVPEDILWRQCPAFLEVKAVDAPFPRNKPSVVKTTLAQGADYARAIFASRPFQLYVLGMYLWKTHFCFAYFDRRGVVLSKEYNLLNDDGLLKFVKAVVRFTWEMSLEDLGHDPSATLIDGTAYYDQEHPRFEVSMGQEQDTRRWRTFGKPLFASHSLLGRGTSVWQSVYLSSGNKTPAILKCAWRSATRTSETEIYDKIKSALGGRVPDGIAQPFTGGDVYLRHVHKPLSIAALRHPMEVPGTEKLVGNIRLHRVTLMDFGKTLVDYRDPKQLALVLISVLKGHKALHEAGILHRDISPGNILIRTLPKWMADGRLVVVDDPEDSGFLTDFEFASVPQPGTVLTTIRKTVPMPNRSRQVRKPTASDAPIQSRHLRFEYVEGKAPPKVRGPGDVITGTATFMASELLLAISKKARIRRSVIHDLESLCWVIFYVVYRRCDADARKKGWAGAGELHREYVELFSAIDADTLFQKRTSRLFSRLKTEDRFFGIEALLVYQKEFEPKLVMVSFLKMLWLQLGKMQPPHDAGVVKAQGDPFLTYYLKKLPQESAPPKRKRTKQDDYETPDTSKHTPTHDILIFLLQPLTGSMDEEVMGAAAMNEEGEEQNSDEEGGEDLEGDEGGDEEYEEEPEAMDVDEEEEEETEDEESGAEEDQVLGLTSESDPDSDFDSDSDD